MAETTDNSTKFDRYLERRRQELEKANTRIQATTERAKILQAEITEAEKLKLHDQAKRTLLPIEAVFDYVEKLGALSRGEMSRPDFDLFLDDLSTLYEQQTIIENTNESEGNFV